MRQIQVCAWLLVVPLVAAACGGNQFTSGDQGDTENTSSGASAGPSFAPPGDDDAPAAGGTRSTSRGGTSSGGPAIGGSYATSGGADLGGSGKGVVGGASGDSCAVGSTKFKLLPSTELPAGYLCDAGCGTGWLTITDAKGAEAFSLFSACGSTSCDSCSPLPCAAAACLPTLLTPQGIDLAWDGTYLAQDTCNMNMACQRADCVPPGRYKAKACAAVNGGQNEMTGPSCTPRTDQLCAEVEFDFPGTEEVVLTLKK